MLTRRTLVQSLTGFLLAIPFLGACSTAVRRSLRRVRPGEPGWPGEAEWQRLADQVGGRLSSPQSPLVECRAASGSPECSRLFQQDLHNPFLIGDDPALTQTLGWADAWTSSPSAYVVAAESAQDVAAAVNFAREHNLRLVVKGGGHSYQGTSNAPDSLLVWTRAMDHIELHDNFVPEGGTAGVPAVSVGAGAVWMHVYDAVTTRAGRYVQGGGCATVGVAGLIQSGGFGSHSKAYGLAAAGLIEAEIVTADGQVRIANQHRNPELFWALKGGGGGSWGVVTRLTLRTRELPEHFAAVFGTVRASSDAAFRELVAFTVGFYRDTLFNPGWGEQIVYHTDNSITIRMVGHGHSQQDLETQWQPLRDWVASRPADFSFESPLQLLSFPARAMWDASTLSGLEPGVVTFDNRPGAPAGNAWWTGDGEEAAQFLHGYRSAWLPAALLEDSARERLVDALIACTREWSVSLHFNKGLAGANPADIEAARDTAINPQVLDAFALAIIAGYQPRVYPGVAGHEPDLNTAREHRAAIDRAMAALLTAAPDAGSYVSESNYFEPDWQRSYWGSNHARLAAVKREYDPAGIFYVHNGVGSEQWADDGFVRLA